MTTWLFSLPAVWLALVILAAIYLATAASYAIVMRLASGERGKAFQAISAGILSPLAIVFALLVGFLAAQVWNDADRAGSAVHREASALRAVVLLAQAFPGETQTRLRDLMRTHIHEAVNREWPEMAHHDATLTLIPAPLASALELSIGLTPHGDGQVAAQRALIDNIQIALDVRRQRIILSGSSVNWVKWMVLLVQAWLTLITVGMIHSGNPRSCRVIMAIFATSVAMAVVLIAAHSRPFAGDFAVRPDVLQQVMPETDR